MLIFFNFYFCNTSSASVTSSGAFKTSIPIQLPKGLLPNSINPNFKLVYNSQTGNGMLGVGWSLSGLSYIARMNNGNGIHYNFSETKTDTFYHSDIGILRKNW